MQEANCRRSRIGFTEEGGSAKVHVGLFDTALEVRQQLEFLSRGLGATFKSYSTEALPEQKWTVDSCLKVGLKGNKLNPKHVFSTCDCLTGPFDIFKTPSDEEELF